MKLSNVDIEISVPMVCLRNEKSADVCQMCHKIHGVLILGI